METKVPRIHAERIRVTFGYEGLFYVDNDGLSGGMALLWKKNNTVSLLSYSQSHIDVEVSLFNKLWRMTCLYGIPEQNRREETWDLLGTLKNRSLLPWVVIGDFNNLLYQHEKKGGNPYPNSLLRGFGDAVDGCGLLQMPMRGHQFTWEKGKGTPNWIEERLDKALITNDWGVMNENAWLENIRTRASDHSILFLSINAMCMPRGRGPRRFRFEMVWLLDEGCKEVVETAWQEGRTEGLLYCQQLCEEKLMRWGGGGDQFHKFGKRIKQLQQRQDTIRNRQDLVALAEYQQIENSLKQIETQEDVFWRQRAKQHWLRGADANTKFYHRYASAHKAPGPDGLNSGFYQQFWEVVGGDVSDFITNALNSCVFPEGLNDTNIVLIPKKEVPETVADLKPIALSNVIYRVMAKMIANTMKTLMGGLISESQSAFIPGRLITDNILVADEVGHYLNRKQCGVVGWSALKLDMLKAYDRMEWTFLERMLTVMGFSEKWIKLIMLCVTTVNYTIMVNDMAGGVARRAPPVSHLFFADDSLLFFKANIQEAGVIRQCLARNTQEGDRAQVADYLGVVQAPNFGKYLGLPSFVGRNKRAVSSYVEEKIRQRIGSWSKKLLSQADSFTSWLKGALAVLTEEQTRLMVAVLYYIWRTRNSAVWKGSMTRPTQVGRAAAAAVQAYGAAQDYRTQPDAPSAPSTEPGGGGLRCYVDAGFRHGTGEATYGILLVAPDGSFVAAKNGKLPVCFSPLMAEAQAYKEALTWLFERKNTSVSLLKDCMELTTIIRQQEVQASVTEVFEGDDMQLILENLPGEVADPGPNPFTEPSGAASDPIQTTKDVQPSDL
ncbi:PREDICTED: uncharacterized protein LOC109168171 [Ipomoea nil]|uniref:uncharacterized protein LOC109168171 n=1 Tax=Ipomoea nil TaxID=35883 RepID=UPI0009016FDF|nr:PREDICTED: uncharacterized protein LOC109168171 [Ipomoea nil]